MALAINCKIGDVVELEHVEHGYVGSFRIDNKASNAVRLIFSMPRTVLVRVMNHRAHGITWGLTAQPVAPVKQAMAAG